MFYRLILKADINVDIKSIDVPWVEIEKKQSWSEEGGLAWSARAGSVIASRVTPVGHHIIIMGLPCMGSFSRIRNHLDQSSEEP